MIYITSDDDDYDEDSKISLIHEPALGNWRARKKTFTPTET